MRKGFTLIELLIVIAIIGILAAALLVSLGGARKAGRDARRITDLRQVQAALELYFNKCARYPGDASCADAASQNWTGMESAVTGASINVTKLPKDPINSLPYIYSYGVEPTIGQSYVLKAVLESDNNALRDDLDGTQAGNVSCGMNPEVSPDWFYCVGI